MRQGRTSGLVTRWPQGLGRSTSLSQRHKTQPWDPKHADRPVLTSPQALSALYSAVMVRGASAPLPEIVHHLLSLPAPSALQRQVIVHAAPTGWASMHAAPAAGASMPATPAEEASMHAAPAAGASMHAAPAEEASMYAATCGCVDMHVALANWAPCMRLLPGGHP
eukprot:149094-Chlamydomonas_euryale.AAC.1